MSNFTAGMFKNYKHFVEELVNKDQGFYFMNLIRGTLVYWKTFRYEVLAMIKQLGCPTFFLTLKNTRSYSNLNKLNLCK